MIEPPKGLLAGAVLAAIESKSPEVLPDPTPHDLPVDPNYFEPTSVAKLTEIIKQLSLLPDTDIKLRDEQRGKFIHVLLDRIVRMEAALISFAQIGMVMSNARLCLRGASKDDEPAGGHWINQVTSTHLATTERYFYTAIDVVGRARMEEHMAKIFQGIQAAQKLSGERDAHIAAGGTVQ